MNRKNEKYIVSGVDLYNVCSHTEAHVVECMRAFLEEHSMQDIAPQAIRDAYAYALNQLPALYPQPDAPAPRDPVRAWDIHTIVENAMHYVIANPKA